MSDTPEDFICMCGKRHKRTPLTTQKALEVMMGAAMAYLMTFPVKEQRKHVTVLKKRPKNKRRNPL